MLNAFPCKDIDLYGTATREMNIFVRSDLLYTKRKACFPADRETPDTGEERYFMFSMRRAQKMIIPEKKEEKRDQEEGEDEEEEEERNGKVKSRELEGYKKNMFCSFCRSDLTEQVRLN